MGFYGNITNTSRTQFQFDKIYPSRRVMEESMNGDGVFVGRYVLVEYDSDVTNIYKQRLYRKDNEYYGNNNEFYYLYLDENLEQKVGYRNSTGSDTSINYGVSGTVAYPGAIAYVVEPSSATTFYQCVGRDGDYAVFQYVDTNSNYVFNYSQDKEWAQDKGYADIGRGWDSTVWQKVYSNGLERYVMIAELNSIVPTFDISADAPSVSPMTPHFDENSTNVYYNLHWQPQWGVRVKAAYNDLKGAVLEDSGAVDQNLSNILLRSSDDHVSYPSDITVNWDKTEYDKSTGDISYFTFGLLTNDNHDGTWVNIHADTDVNINKAKNGIPGAIYFNKDGFDSVNISKSSDLFNGYRQSKFNYVSDIKEWPNKKFIDDIKLVPTGLSGHKYNQHSGVFDKRPNVDTYEFSMMLPSLGDTISDIWDLIYGGRKITAIRASGKRNQNIEWEDASQGQEKSGLRLVHFKENNKFSYDVDEINTLAGCINSAHDIMGMIIQDTRLANNNTGMDFSNQTILNNLNSDNIYYYGESYYRKRKFYDYIAPAQGESVHNYEQVNLTNFTTDTYYEKVISNYLLLSSAPEDGHTVYTLDGTPKKINGTGLFAQTYAANKFYYTTPAYPQAEEGSERASYYHYTLDTDAVYDPSRSYVSLYKYDSDGNYEAEYQNGILVSEPIRHELYFYRENAYWYFESEDTGNLPEVDEQPKCDSNSYMSHGQPDPNDSNITLPNRKYYYQTTVRERNIVTNEWIETQVYTRIPDGNIVMFEENTYFEFDNNTYFLILESPNNILDGKFAPKVCFTLPWPKLHPDATYFYQGGLYYYKPIGTNNYILDTNINYTPNREYYEAPSFTAHNNIVFYKTNTYYVTDNAQTEPDSNASPSSAAFESSKTYWKKTDWYVASDSNNKYAVGMKWDKTVTVPSGVTLCNRTERWGVEELDGFATKVNTMLGLILRIKAILDEGNSDTRDTNTVQGCINTINDIIAKFGERKVTDVMITNNYGQVAGARQTTAQSYQYSNIGTVQSSTATADQEDQWIYWNVNPNYSDPVITLKHKLVSEGHAATATTTTADLNNTSSGNGLNVGNTDTLELYTPIIDIAGHVVGQNTETVTLPYGFKTISLTQSSAVSNLTTNTTSIEAENTQDTLNIQSANKWIRFAGTNGAAGATDILKVGHLVGTITTSSVSGTDLNDGTNTLNVPDISYDEAGHITAKQGHSYTLPYGFKNLKSAAQSDVGTAWSVAAGAETTIAATNTQDTFTFATGNKWIRLDPDSNNKTFTFAHMTVRSSSGSFGNSSNQEPNFGSTFNVPYITVDVAGHVSAISNKTVKIPTGSLSDTIANGADVITQLSFTDTTGALSTTRTNVGTLLLTGYDSNGVSGIAATDSINSALRKLQVQSNTSTSAITTLNGNSSTEGSVEYKITTAINSLDATKTQSAGTDGLALSITEENGKITAISGSIAANTYDAYGAASAVIGDVTDTSSDNTIHGIRAYIDERAMPAFPENHQNSAAYVLKCYTTDMGVPEYFWILET